VHFCHSPEIWNDYPELVPGVLAANGIGAEVDVQPRFGRFTAAAESRLAALRKRRRSASEAHRY
jgi:hypothetical protein